MPKERVNEELIELSKAVYQTACEVENKTGTVALMQKNCDKASYTLNFHNQQLGIAQEALNEALDRLEKAQDTLAAYLKPKPPVEPEAVPEAQGQSQIQSEERFFGREED